MDFNVQERQCLSLFGPPRKVYGAVPTIKVLEKRGRVTRVRKNGEYVVNISPVINEFKGLWAIVQPRAYMMAHEDVGNGP